ncbi:MAG: hypothetical protein ACREJO_16840 [Phycisphaerales bacterium]
MIGVLITGVWGASRWWFLMYTAWPWQVRAYDGKLALVETDDPLKGNGLQITRAAGYWNWVISGDKWKDDTSASTVRLGIVMYVDGGRYTSVIGAKRLLFILPWPFALASLLGGGWLVWSGRRARRRAMTGVCVKCGYDLSGLGAESVCPECGAAMSVR